MVAGILLRRLLLDGTLSSIRIAHCSVPIWPLREGPKLDLDLSSGMDHHIALFRRFFRYPIPYRRCGRIWLAIWWFMRRIRPHSQPFKGYYGYYSRFSGDRIWQQPLAGQTSLGQAGPCEKHSQRPAKTRDYLISRARVSGRIPIICCQNCGSREGLPKATIWCTQEASGTP